MNRALTSAGERLLDAILSQPAAPFREELVAREVTRALDAAAVPHFRDDVGNLVVGVDSRKAYLARLRRASRDPVRLFIAHMDHPGFHGVRWRSDTELEFRWHGGSPRAFLEGAPVWLSDGSGLVGDGEIARAELDPKGLAIRRGVVRLSGDIRPRAKRAKALFGGFRFRAPVWREGDLIYTKAADDLVGAFAITQLACELHRARSPRRDAFLGLLTRAEEVGFVGCIGHFDLGWLRRARRPVVCVSLETSRTLPGAVVGGGPVVRLGDRATTFDPAALQVLTEIARKTLPKQHQRRIMDGGTCEATVATAFGYPAVGLSVPLGNYHNQSLEGGPDSRGELGPAPEFVDSRDIAGLIALCHGLLAPVTAWSEPWAAKTAELRKRVTSYRSLLAGSPS